MECQTMPVINEKLFHFLQRLMGQFFSNLQLNHDVTNLFCGNSPVTIRTFLNVFEQNGLGDVDFSCPVSNQPQHSKMIQTVETSSQQNGEETYFLNESDVEEKIVPDEEDASKNLALKQMDIQNGEIIWQNVGGTPEIVPSFSFDGINNNQAQSHTFSEAAMEEARRSNCAGFSGVPIVQLVRVSIPVSHEKEKSAHGNNELSASPLVAPTMSLADVSEQENGISLQKPMSGWKVGSSRNDADPEHVVTPRAIRSPIENDSNTDAQKPTKMIPSPRRRNGKFSCRVCESEFSRSDNYQRHYLEKHLMKQKKKCMYCSSAFAYERDLKYHQRVCVSGPTPDPGYICEFCGAKYEYTKPGLHHQRNRCKLLRKS